MVFSPAVLAVLASSKFMGDEDFGQKTQHSFEDCHLKCQKEMIMEKTDEGCLGYFKNCVADCLKQDKDDIPPNELIKAMEQWQEECNKAGHEGWKPMGDVCGDNSSSRVAKEDCDSFIGSFIGQVLGAQSPDVRFKVMAKELPDQAAEARMEARRRQMEETTKKKGGQVGERLIEMAKELRDQAVEALRKQMGETTKKQGGQVDERLKATAAVARWKQIREARRKQIKETLRKQIKETLRKQREEEKAKRQGGQVGNGSLSMPRPRLSRNSGEAGLLDVPIAVDNTCQSTELQRSDETFAAPDNDAYCFLDHVPHSGESCTELAVGSKCNYHCINLCPGCANEKQVCEKKAICTEDGFSKLQVKVFSSIFLDNLPQKCKAKGTSR